jgi:hypothetical protein
MTLPIALMRKFPNFELIFSVGEGRLVPIGTAEAELAKVFYEAHHPREKILIKTSMFTLLSKQLSVVCK